ncbi:MAG: glycosyltransferase family 4 protein [bacterium]
MKVLVISSMFPNNVQPVYGVFVKNRMAEVGKSCELKVVSPVPSTPLVGWMKRYAYRSKVAGHLNIDGLEVYYPRHFSIPKFFKPLDGLFFFFSLYLFAKRLKKVFDFDLIDAHLAYPDGFAAVLLGRLFKVPVTVTLRGHDIFDLPRYPVRGRQVKFALKQAARVFSVARSLKEGAVELGIPAEKIKVIPNGVDTDKFYPVDRQSARRELGLDSREKIVLSVGHLVERKGFHLLIEAVSLLREDVPVSLIIIGSAGIEGDMKKYLENLAVSLGISDKVRFVQAMPHEELVMWYNASDLFCLASSREGMANVLLEAGACGIPALAVNCWGNSEVIDNRDCGILMENNDPEKIARGISQALNRTWNRKGISRRSQTWKTVAKRVVTEFERLLKT